MMPPRYSVVVPLYNKARCIARTLYSAINQTYPPYEIIVVDDGSQDGSGLIVEELNEPLVKLITQSNGGVSAARNRGISEAKGDWIAFLDADDLWHPEHLETLAKSVAHRPNIGIAGNRYVSTQEDQITSPKIWCQAADVEELIDCLPARWMQGSTFFTSSIATKKELLESMDTWFPEGESNGEDLDLWFRLAERSQIVLSARALVARVWTADGLSVIQSKAEIPAFADRLESRALNGTAPPRLREPYIQLVTHIRLTSARVLVGQGRRLEAIAVAVRVHRGYASKRWWVTLVMAFFVPARLATEWQTWRKRRKMIIG